MHATAMFFLLAVLTTISSYSLNKKVGHKITSSPETFNPGDLHRDVDNSIFYASSDILNPFKKMDELEKILKPSEIQKG